MFFLTLFIHFTFISFYAPVSYYIVLPCDVIDRILRGAFSVVKLAINKKTGEKVAVKIIDKTQASAEADEKRLKTEVAILKQVKHPNIVCLKDLFETPQTLYLIMELYVIVYAVLLIYTVFNELIY